MRQISIMTIIININIITTTQGIVRIHNGGNQQRQHEYHHHHQHHQHHQHHDQGIVTIHNGGCGQVQSVT